jgi:hypothetical protein
MINVTSSSQDAIVHAWTDSVERFETDLIKPEYVIRKQLARDAAQRKSFFKSPLAWFTSFVRGVWTIKDLIEVRFQVQGLSHNLEESRSSNYF